MSDPVSPLVPAAGLSDAAYRLIKKLPVIGKYIQYQDGLEIMDDALNASFASEIRILNDPERQLAFINSFDPEHRKAAMGHIIDVQQGHKKHINVTEILMMAVDELKESENTDNDDPIHPDWWTLWVDKAQMTSDPVKQDAFSKILAAETVSPGTISPKTIRILADLPVSDIELLKKASSYFSTEGYCFTPDQYSTYMEQLSLNKMRLLNESSLLNFPTGIGEHRLVTPSKINDMDCIAMVYIDYVIILWDYKTPHIPYQATLSREGLILRDTLGFRCDLEVVKSTAEEFYKRTGKRVSVNRMVDADKVDLKHLAVYETESKKAAPKDGQDSLLTEEPVD